MVSRVVGLLVRSGQGVVEINSIRAGGGSAHISSIGLKNKGSNNIR